MLLSRLLLSQNYLSPAFSYRSPYYENDYRHMKLKTITV